MGTSDKVEALKKKRAKIDQELAQLKAREREQKRKEETRLKILLGAAILDQAQSSPETATQVQRLLDRYTKNARDRQFLARLGWLPEESR